MAEPPARTPTVAAILTALGQGGIAVLHVVGPRALDLAAQLFRPKRPLPPRPDPSRLHYGHVVAGDETIDEVLVRLLPADASPYGEPAVEVNCHGGIVAVQRVLACFAARGASPAEPEALLDRQARTPIQAEAARALLRAPTPLGADVLLDQLNGALDDALAALPWDQPGQAQARIRTLRDTERLGLALWNPPRVVLAGPTNAGKSTLFNALAREDRVIVSPTPGTTRDTVSAEVALGGVPVWLVDTAGQRDSDSIIEREAIARARSAAATAALVLLVLDAAAPLPVPLGELQRPIAAPTLLVLNKTDRPPAPWTRAVADAVRCSAVEGAGLGALTTRIVETLVGHAVYEPGRPVVFTRRQATLLRAALEQLQRGDLGAARRAVDQCILASGDPASAR